MHNIFLKNNLIARIFSTNIMYYFLLDLNIKIMFYLLSAADCKAHLKLKIKIIFKIGYFIII